MENFNNFYKFKEDRCDEYALDLLLATTKKFCMNWNANKYFENAEMTMNFTTIGLIKNEIFVQLK